MYLPQNIIQVVSLLATPDAQNTRGAGYVENQNQKTYEMHAPRIRT